MPVFLIQTAVAGAGQFALTVDFNATFGVDILPLDQMVTILSWSYRTNGATPHSQTLICFDPNDVAANGILCVEEVNNLAFLESCGAHGIFVVPRVSAAVNQGDCFQFSFVTVAKAEAATFRLHVKIGPVG